MTLIIAEAGVNHNGNEKLAFELVDAAHKAGADIVKFQTFKAKNLVTEQAKQADYQVANTQRQESQLDMLSRLELSWEAHHKLVAYCQSLGIEFLSTAFDSESLSFLVNELGIQRLKIPSGELTNAPLVLEHARTGCDIIVSTGMATLAEIEDALGVIAFGYTTEKDTPPGIEAFQRAYASAEGQQALKDKVVILHCTTEYPAPLEEINLRVMDTLHQAFALPAGYSDHSEGITIPVAAVARGAIVIEKHFTLDKNMEGPDHKASLEPHELADMIKAIRQVERALGHTIKTPTVSEIKNKSVARKSLVAAKEISIGERFGENNLTIKRPGTGMSPYEYWELQGKCATKSYQPGDLISE
ncbi:TPA: N-acetylneuraminate synthase [Enterobacter cloacae]|uniref:N-acetylneuraminate synthase n=1 Tax=Enterobacter cloacae TaxID=550 RepID=UPI00125A0308|nr:N-acetylneuraminate synthase [Enterobacter cloacae]VAM11653.1 Spore coat polysaccharide biosynthesis protein spsE [Enterobacter kobei]MCK7317393.1 N-acetylneuraminate synthase [Enterobacter cloacae]VAC86775.1 Spore coat polysaccharide biosynthesis protein spsE [Enterobacter cloacae]HCC8047074.1 N-acetylneuraminate synthase [Enterobacter cloacae]HCR1076590.1 N-acetylneuraminate synthase [Enterobacter cloacae]